MAGLPLAAGGLIAARPFARAAVRYRIVAAAFVLSVAVGPLALAAAALRTAPSPLAGSPPAGAGVLAALAGPALAVAAVVGLALMLELASDVIKLRRVKRSAAPLGTVAVRRATIGTSRTVSTPTAIGYLHPAVVLPEGFRALVDEREWNAVVAHECAHLARGDDWAKALQSAALRAGWWLPGLWILGRALDLERELASDERAACVTGARRYAACLLRLATDRPDGLAPAFGGRRSHVAIRVERLLRPVADHGVAARAATLGAFTAAAFAVVGTAVLALPGTGAPAATTGAPHVAPPTAVVHAGPRHPAARIAERAHRPNAAARHETAKVALAGTGAPPAPVGPVLARAAAAAAPAPAPAAPETGPRRTAAAPAPAANRRSEVRRAPSIRPEAAVEIAFVAPHRRCRTCFGPLRSPDDAAAAEPPSFSPPAALSGGSAAIAAAGDPTSGPVDLSSQMVWFRLPSRLTQSQ